MRYRFDIQVLRGFAVLLVVLFHLEVSGFQNGYLGVDIFFVISGFLMAQLYDRGTALNFYSRRIKRLLPAYITVIAGTTFAVTLIAVPVDANQAYKQAALALVGMSNIGFWWENSYFDPVAFKPLLNLWSLGVELQYYLIVPLLLPILNRWRFLLIAALLTSLALALVMTTISPKTSFFLLPFRVWEFLLGAVAAWLFTSKSNIPRGALVSALSIGALVLLMFFPLQENATTIMRGHPGVAAVLASLVATFILVRPLHGWFSNKTVLGRAFVYLGERSYSIYLVHFPVIVLLNYVEFGGTRLGFESPIILASSITLTAILSLLMYRYIESIRHSEMFLGRMAIIAVISCVLVSGAAIWKKGNYTAEQRKIFAAWEDRSTYRCGKIFRILNPTEHICLISGKSGSESALLIGNSHADSIKSAFASALFERQIRTYFYVPNNPLMDSGIEPETVLADVSRFDVKAVVFHYAPSFYERESFVPKLRKTISALAQENVKVYIIAPVPIYESHVPKSLYRETLSRGIEFARITVEQYNDMNVDFFELVQDLNSVEEVYWPTSKLCPAKRCLVQSNGSPLYFDSHHLTLTGAAFLTPIFEEIAASIREGS